MPVLAQGDNTTATANLNQTIAGAYNPAQVQAISDKLDERLGNCAPRGL